LPISIRNKKKTQIRNSVRDESALRRLLLVLWLDSGLGVRVSLGALAPALKLRLHVLLGGRARVRVRQGRPEALQHLLLRRQELLGLDACLGRLLHRHPLLNVLLLLLALLSRLSLGRPLLQRKRIKGLD